MQLICPCCHTRYPLDAANQDEAARDLLALRGDLPSRLWSPIIAYLGLFRSETRALAWDRALKLAREVMALQADPDVLETALYTTVEALRAKGGKPMKNHNYLKSVIETAAASGIAVVPAGDRRPQREERKSKRVAAFEALTAWGASDWLRSEIANGLQALLAMSLKNTPAAETITAAGDVWFVALQKEGITIEEVDAARVRAGFVKLVGKVKEWPAVKMLTDEMPPRPRRPAIAQARPEPTEEGRSAFKEMMGD